MTWLVENWPIIVAIVVVIAFAAAYIINFIKLPRAEQISKISEWLLWAVADAEKTLGGGTGQLKLRYVYDAFVAKFPAAAKFIKFDVFSGLVDEALSKFNDMLQENTKIEEYVTMDSVTPIRIIEKKEEVNE